MTRPPRFPDFDVIIVEDPELDGDPSFAGLLMRGLRVAILRSDTGPNSAGGRKGNGIFQIIAPVDGHVARNPEALREVLGRRMMAEYHAAHPRGHAHLGTAR